MDADPIRTLLPWKHPFLMIDRMIECVPHRHIVTAKNVTGDDAMADGECARGVDFPDVLVVEGMSQSAALLFQLTYGRISDGRVPLLGSLKAAWKAPARPGDIIIYRVAALKMTSTMGIFHGVAHVADAAIAEAELAFAVTASASGTGAGPTAAGAGA